MTDDLISSLESESVQIRRGKSGAVLSVDFREATQAGLQAELTKLSVHQKIRELYLNGTSISDDDLARIVGSLERLQVLDLQQTSVSEVGITQLTHLKNLTLLLLSEGQASHEFLAEFRKRMIQTRIVVS